MYLGKLGFLSHSQNMVNLYLEKRENISQSSNVFHRGNEIIYIGIPNIDMIPT